MQKYFDKLAVGLSATCAVHCVAFPIIAGLIPVFSSAMIHTQKLHQFWFHQFILIFILPISIIAMISGYRCHRNIVPLLISLLGLTILVLTALFAGPLMYNRIIPVGSETWFTVAGGIIHAIGHLLNLYSTKNSQPVCTNEPF